MACSSNDGAPSPLPTGGGTQAGTGGGAQAQAGSVTGGASAQAGTGTSGSTSTPTSTAGASGSASGGTGNVGGNSASGTSSGGAAGTGGSGTAGAGGTVDPTKLDKFSFFVTSMAAMFRLSKSTKGFGGDLRYGTADGLTGADKICTEIAESSMPGASAKQWHAFLSTTKVNAKDRIGVGPWYDRAGRLVAQDLTNLLMQRPNGGDAAIKNDLPNENGIGNHRPNPAAAEDDNHHTLTGSNAQGTLLSANNTCKDWTTTSTDNSNAGAGRPQTGYSWSTGNRVHWFNGQIEGGCGAGATGIGMVNGGSDPGNPIVGSGGGYGGIYCFAIVP